MDSRGWTNYLEGLYVEYHFGHDEALRYVNNGKNRVGNRQPIMGATCIRRRRAISTKKASSCRTPCAGVINDNTKWWKLQKDFFSEVQIPKRH